MKVGALRPLKLLRRLETPSPVHFFRRLRTRGNAISAISASFAAPTKSAGQRGSRKETWSRFWPCERCRDRSLRCRSATSNQRGVWRDPFYRGGSWDRKNHRPCWANSRPDPRWRRNARSHRRGHLHRKGRRRNEASSAQRHRKSKVESDARGTRSARPSARGAGARTYRHDPRLLRRSPP